MLEEFFIRVGVILVTSLILLVTWSWMSLIPANKIGLSPKRRAALDRAVTMIGLIIALALAVMPLEYYPGFLLGWFFIVIGFYYMADGLFQISFSNLWPQIWGRSYKPITERLFGAEGRRALRQSGRLFFGILFVIIGVSIMLVVLYSLFISHS